MNISRLDIVELRKKIGISQEKLAELIGVSLRTVQNYEAGKKIPQSKYALLRNLQNGNAGNPVINQNVLEIMEDRITALEQLLQKRDEEIITLTTELVKLKKELLGLGKHPANVGPGELEGRRDTG